MKETARKLREEDAKKWTQKAMAEALGLTRECVSAWFNRPTTNGTSTRSCKPDARVKVKPEAKKKAADQKAEARRRMKETAQKLREEDARKWTQKRVAANRSPLGGPAMLPTYRAAPTTTCNAPAKSFPRPLEACQFARQAADAFRVGYCVYKDLAGRLNRVAAYSPNTVRA
jgi:predicted transcriptional regulator